MFHTARTLDEVILLAPLFDHPSVFDISLHYTGKTPLPTSTLIMPSPVPLEDETPHGHFACNTESLLKLCDAPNLLVYNGDASASIANSRALSRRLSMSSNRRLSMSLPEPPIMRKEASIQEEALNLREASNLSSVGNEGRGGRIAVKKGKGKGNAKRSKFEGQDIGGFKRIQPTFEPEPEPRLIGIRGKWEGLVVWVGAWFCAFWTLVRPSTVSFYIII